MGAEGAVAPTPTCRQGGGGGIKCPHPFHRFSGMMPASMDKFFDKSFKINKLSPVVTATSLSCEKNGNFDRSIIETLKQIVVKLVTIELCRREDPLPSLLEMKG